jgi:hypothetical protein
MSQIVKCDICGGIYNQSHLSSHKRLSHGKREASPSLSNNVPPSIEVVLSLYARLPEESKKQVRARLGATEHSRT